MSSHIVKDSLLSMSTSAEIWPSHDSYYCIIKSKCSSPFGKQIKWLPFLSFTVEVLCYKNHYWFLRIKFETSSTCSDCKHLWLCMIKIHEGSLWTSAVDFLPCTGQLKCGEHWSFYNCILSSHIFFPPQRIPDSGKENQLWTLETAEASVQGTAVLLELVPKQQAQYWNTGVFWQIASDCCEAGSMTEHRKWLMWSCAPLFVQWRYRLHAIAF